MYTTHFKYSFFDLTFKGVLIKFFASIFVLYIILGLLGIK